MSNGTHRDLMRVSAMLDARVAHVVPEQDLSLQELTPAIAATASHLFSMQPAYEIRTTNLRPHSGDRSSATNASATLTVSDAAGHMLRALTPTTTRGINRVVWNLRDADVPIRSGGGEDDDEGGARAASPGPLVLPGTYTVSLSAGGVTTTQKVVVREDPRLKVSASNRAAWTACQRRRRCGHALQSCGGTCAEVHRHRCKDGGPVPAADQKAQLAYCQKWRRSWVRRFDDLHPTISVRAPFMSGPPPCYRNFTPENQ